MPPLVSIIIPVYNQVNLLDRCLVSLARQQGAVLEVWVVDDCSPESPDRVLAAHPWVKSIRLAENSGYASANNEGLARATGSYLLFLNSDTELPPDGIAQMIEYLEAHPEAGGVSPLHREPDGAIQRTCFRFPTLQTGLCWDSVIHVRNPNHPAITGYAMADWDHQSERWVEHAQTSCLLVRRAVYERIGGMDPQLVLFYNDTDFCHRMTRAGFPIRFVAEIEIVHHGGASVRTAQLAEARVYSDRYRYYAKWFGLRGKLAIRAALWSRIGYETLVEAAHGQFRFAARKMSRGWRLNRLMRA